MPPLDPATLWALLAHPLSIVAISLLAATGVSMLVGAQLRAIGLDPRPSGDHVRWSTVFAVASFWGTLLLGLHLAAALAELPHVPGLLQDAYSTLLMLVPAGLILAGASRFRAQYLRDAADQRELDEGTARQRADIGMAVAGALAALGLTGQGFGAFLLTVALCAGGVWMLRSSDNRDKVSAAINDFFAGQALRARSVGPGTALELDGERVQLLGLVGTLSTRVHGPSGERALQNQALLSALTKTKQLPGMEL